MSKHIIGIKPPDDKWLAMKAVYDACILAKITVPHEVISFFGGDEPDAMGVRVRQSILEKCGAVIEYSADMRDGFEIDITKLPKDVKIIRVYNSY
jgi:hypothetical protein